MDDMTGTAEKKDYKNTLNLPRTSFPMRAGLNEAEPRRVARWEAMGLFDRMKQKNAGRPPFHLHDGPPYANGHIHLGHALNKTLKDIVVRYKSLRGFYTEFIPGWDCHGLPIEQKVVQDMAKDKEHVSDPIEIRRRCQAYAEKFIAVQRDEFKRLLCAGQWHSPYVTMNPAFEVGVLTCLRTLVEKGFIYKGMKSVYWDWVFETALAEAEIEYNDHVSDSIYVKFPILDAQGRAALEGLPRPTIVIWTTTPWTLPANLAVCLHPLFDYVALRHGDETFIVAEGLAEDFERACGLPRLERAARLRGQDLEHLRCAHPMFEDKTSLVILGPHVTLEQGTGCVHTAPGHGEEDFVVGQQYGLDVVVPVDERGCFTSYFPPMQGMNVFDANPRIVQWLRERGLLLGHSKYRHKYAFSWRSKKPIIYRATEQWFMKVDADGLREQALAEIDRIQWIPGWGRDRIYHMVEGRPDWCLSRQRSWGVPIPSLYSRKAGRSVLALPVLDRFIELVRRHGTDCWYERPVEDFLPEGFTCPYSGGTEFEKEFNVLDVWFDSGSSWMAIQTQLPDRHLSFPCDLYLEGSDQHRGWFQSSLWIGLGVAGRAPYKAVLTHGFILDDKGQPMSKSLGNVIPPQKIIEQFGADVLRLWVASTDYRGDVAISMGILSQVGEAYRRIRNTFRFLLGNLADFHVETDSVPVEQMGELDRWALWQLAQLVRRVTDAYDEYEFHKVYYLTHQFCVVQMSALYLDVVKDRLYCEGPSDPRRRATQTVLWHITNTLARLLAPVLPHTTDEVWEAAGFSPESVHLSDFPEAPDRWLDFPESSAWERLLEVREAVARRLEALRRGKIIGHSLDAAVTLRAPAGPLFDLLKRYSSQLAELFIVSQCCVEAVTERSGGPAEAGETALNLDVDVQKATGGKCARCWMISPSIGQSPEYPDVCPRCEDVLRRYW
ncbi:MAG: isoleucine--tRNA ligase [Candidatus Sumerlaeia bacterium]